MRSKANGIAIVAIASLALAAPAAAKTYEVTKRGDPTPGPCKKKDCSLREAVLAANGHAGADRIVLPKRKTYNLSVENSVPPGEDEAAEGDLDITDPLRVTHPGKGRAKVDANGIDRVFDLVEGAPATFKKLVVRGGDDPDSGDTGGGGIQADDADLSLRRTSVSQNHSDGSYGGGIELNGASSLTMARSALNGNTSTNDSGGMETDSEATFSIKRSKVTGNVADGSGGGIYVDGGSGQIVKSTIAGNTADNSGGGIAGFGDVTITNSTVANNTASDGGGVVSHQLLAVTNSTFAGNRADGNGGGVSATGSGIDARFNAVTVARNSAGVEGGGVFFDPAGGGPGFAIENTLIGLNGAPDGADCFSEVGSEFDSAGHNLLSTEADCDGFDATGDLVNPNPKLGQLKNNGGPTQTVALKKGSPAINKANKATAPKRDQRGVKRGKKPDIGAYERVKKKKHRHRH